MCTFGNGLNYNRYKENIFLKIKKEFHIGWRPTPGNITTESTYYVKKKYPLETSSDENIWVEKRNWPESYILSKVQYS